MSEYLMVDVSPQVSVMFEDEKPIRVFVDINAVVDELNESVERAKDLIKKQ